MKPLNKTGATFCAAHTAFLRHLFRWYLREPLPGQQTIRPCQILVLYFAKGVHSQLRTWCPPKISARERHALGPIQYCLYRLHYPNRFPCFGKAENVLARSHQQNPEAQKGTKSQVPIRLSRSITKTTMTLSWNPRKTWSCNFMMKRFSRFKTYLSLSVSKAKSWMEYVYVWVSAIKLPGITQLLLPDATSGLWSYIACIITLQSNCILPKRNGCPWSTCRRIIRERRGTSPSLSRRGRLEDLHRSNLWDDI